MNKKRIIDAMFPAGEDTPLISGTPVPITLPELLQLTAVDPGAPEGDQSVLFVMEPVAFAPAAIVANLSSGSWMMQGRAPISGHAFEITTSGATGREYPVALVVTAADAAVLAQAKHLLALVIRAFAVPASKVADPDWEAYRADARRVLESCTRKAESL
jgi:hypothetical protein